MDCLLFAALSKAVAEKSPEVDEDGDYQLGPEDQRLLRRRRHRHRRRQRERRMRRLTVSGLRPYQVQAMEETVRRSERVLRRSLPPTPQPSVVDVIAVVGVMSGALVAGFIGWALLLVGALLLMCRAVGIILQDNQRRPWEDRRADAEKDLADVRAVLERTGNADLLPLQDW